MKTEYVVGFLFVGDEVVLIEKQKPEWQKGRLNGVGGKIEPGEIPAQAMEREFKEETGEVRSNWERFARIEYPDCVVHFFKAFDTNTTAHTTTNECIMRFPYLYATDGSKVVPNLKWLIPMALSGCPFHSMTEQP